MSFELPEDSSMLPSTPNARSLRSHPSTTPLVPPPTYLSHVSTTPAEPPPRSIFGSSYPTKHNTFRGQSGLKNFTLPESSPPHAIDDDFTIPDVEEGVVDLQHTGHGLAQSGRLTDSIRNTPRGLKRSRNGAPRIQTMAPIARGLADHQRVSRLQESDMLILRTEALVSKLDAATQNLDLQEPKEAITSAIKELEAQWQENQESETKEASVGPATDDPVAQASYVASFVLRLHHPHDNKAQSKLRDRSTQTPVPQALLEWLNYHHNPFPDDFDSIYTHQPTPAAHESFWDVILSSMLRGKLDRVVSLMQNAGWESAVTALDEGSDTPGYRGQQLQNTREIVDRFVSILLQCPALRNGNWDIKGNEWSLFRQRVRSAVHELEAFAEGDRDVPDRANVFAQSARHSLNLSTASRKARSKIPWTLYENLKVLYAQLQGSSDEILLISQDWLEAAIFLTVWWDGNDSTRTHRKQHAREVDVTPLLAYQYRLRDVFTFVTNQPEDPVFTVDTLDMAQVGIACAMEGHTEGVIAILRALSLPIASAVADIAALNEWLPQSRPRSRGLMEQDFDNDDLLVLSHDSPVPRGEIDRDDLLSTYAALLAHKQTLESGTDSRQGWELAASVLGRMSNHMLADRKISELFDRVDIANDADADKVLHLCSRLGLAEQSRRISERYADHLADTSSSYGAMLVFYARAHAMHKVRDVLNMLTSLCLTQSAAMPPQQKLDPTLLSLLTDERDALSRLASNDSQAGAQLASQLSGYATLRRFYELRDEALRRGRSPSLQQRRQAASALLAVIVSASDCIRGGLLDSSIESIIPVNGLLVLLCEVLPFCGHPKRVLERGHVFTLLRVIEDFDTGPARIRDSGEDLLKMCAQIKEPLLKKSISNVSSTSGVSGSSYDLLATSSMLLSQNDKPILVQRAWDWRDGLSGIGSESINATTLLLILRVALANELGRPN